MNLFENIRKRGFKDILDPDKWRAWASWMLKVGLQKLGSSEILLEHWEIEQYMYRLIMCKDCIDAGKCAHCGCDIMGLISDQKSSCSAGKWAPMLPDYQWEDFKEKHGIKIVIKYE